MQLDLEYRNFAPTKKKAVSKLIGVSEDVEWLELQEVFLPNLDLLRQKKIFSVSAPYFKYLEKHRDTILLTNEFFYKLGRNPKKNTKYDNTKLKRALGKAL